MSRFILFFFIIGMLYSCGGTRYGYDHYLQRQPSVVAVVPAIYKGDLPEAQIIVDKAWSKLMVDMGFQVTNSDQVITYAASRGTLIRELENIPYQDLAKDLGVDLLLVTKIHQWKSQWAVTYSYSEVSGRTQLVDGHAAAIIWQYDWVVVNESNSGGSLEGMASVLTTAIVNSATDHMARIADHAIDAAGQTLPRPGYAPELSR